MSASRPTTAGREQMCCQTETTSVCTIWFGRRQGCTFIRYMPNVVKCLWQMSPTITLHGARCNLPILNSHQYVYLRSLLCLLPMFWRTLESATFTLRFYYAWVCVLSLYELACLLSISLINSLKVPASFSFWVSTPNMKIIRELWGC